MVEKKETQTQSVDFHYDCDLKNQEERIRAGACEQTTVMYLVACSIGFSFSFTFSLFFSAFRSSFFVSIERTLAFLYLS